MMVTAVRVGFVLVVMLSFIATSACETNPDDRQAEKPSRTHPPPVQVASGKSREVRSMVRTFMERRVSGNGAERFLDADGRRDYRSGTVRPLYPKPALTNFEIVFVDDLGDGTYEVGVELIFDEGRYGETLFVHGAQDRFVISGGRPGLVGP